MKRIWHHPEEPKTGKRFWRSIGELEDTPEFRSWLDREFPQGAAEMADDTDRDLSRRSFIRLMGASTALAGLGMAGCRRPVEKILPFAHHVEWVIPGKPLLYATSMPRAGGAVPMVVTTHEGRPTHVQGNPLHPASNGSCDSFATASILDLYDPARQRQFLNEGQPVGPVAIDRMVAAQARAAREGAQIGILVGWDESPTRLRLLQELQQSMPNLRVFRHESISPAIASDTARRLHGSPVRDYVDLSQAERVLTVDCDFMGLDRHHGKAVTDFMAGRKGESADDPMNRLYAVENRYTLTGGMADHRLPLPASRMAAFAAALATELGGSLGGELNQIAASYPGKVDDRTMEWLRPAAADLASHAGKAVVLAGSQLEPAVHTLVAAINRALNAYDGIIRQLADTGSEGVEFGSIADLAAAATEGELESLWILGPGDPVYDAPADLDLGTVLADHVPQVIHLALRKNATASAANWVLPAAHYLETWGDTRTADGSYSIVQPMILPLFGGASDLQVLLALLGRYKFAEQPTAGVEDIDPEADPIDPEADPGDQDPAADDLPGDPAHAAVRETFRAMIGDADEELQWSYLLRDGFAKDSGFAGSSATVDFDAAREIVSSAINRSQVSRENFELVFAPDHSMWDGRYINNGWLQEAPDPITKLTWDNAAWLSPRTFRELGLRRAGQMIRITLGDRSLVIPALEAPGHAHYSITLPLGYGQQDTAGLVGEGTGFNTGSLRTNEEPFVATGARVEPLREFHPLAVTAEHYSMKGRALARMNTLDNWRKNDTFAAYQGMDSHIPENITLYKGQIGRRTEDNPEGFDYERLHQWGMTIDLNQCIGCNACLVACQSENNIPIVGKSQVIRGREMHWIRLDRYFATPDTVKEQPTMEQLDNPEMIVQAVACQQCESAPCEVVCPVNATVHTEEGLNAMAYNRCIGTRYCANNCPYKARRFNYFDYNKRNPLTTADTPVGEIGNLYLGPLGERADTELSKLQKNPNVSVRMRGVMEKCTYCVQRLEEAKIRHKQQVRGSSDVRIPADAVKVACQQACPAGAIEFGDLANPDSRINKVKANPRNYELLKYVGTVPRTTYLARIKNVNKDMPGYQDIGVLTHKMH